MTEAKQARLKELAQIERDRELATLNAQSAVLELERPAADPPKPLESHSESVEPPVEPPAAASH